MVNVLEDENTTIITDGKVTGATTSTTSSQILINETNTLPNKVIRLIK